LTILETDKTTKGTIMKTKIVSGNGTQAAITLTLPTEVLGDLKKTATFNETALGDLVYSYIIDGLAGDAIAAKRMQFTDNTDPVPGRRNRYPGAVEDLLKDLMP
jgi:hypothetical protein